MKRAIFENRRQQHYFFSPLRLSRLNRILLLSTTAEHELNQQQIVDYFQLFEMQRTFSVNLPSLKEKYKNIMKELHPDRHTSKAKDEQDVIHEQASQMTHAYGILSDPHDRSLHLLELHDHPFQDDTKVDMATLAFVMEIREQVDEASQETLKILSMENKRRIEETCSLIGRAFEEDNLEQAVLATAKLQYWNRIEESIRNNTTE